jgi:hypothetical protein
MVQAETRWIRNTDKYDAKQNTLVTVFNIILVEWDQSYFKLLEKVKLAFIVLLVIMWLHKGK